MSPLTEKCRGKYLKKLVGRTEVEDALKKLDKSTIEEARMATAETLKLTYTVGNTVRGVEDKVLDVDKRVAGVDDKVAGVDNRVACVDDRVAGIDDRVAGVDNRVAGFDDRVAGVDDRVAGVDDRVAGVDERVASVDNRVEAVEVRVAGVDETVKAVEDKVAVAIDGAQPSSIGHQEIIFNPHVSRGKTGKGCHTTDRKQYGSSETFVICINSYSGCAYSRILIGNQLRQDLLRWLSPPDPSTNHNIACGAHHKRTAKWFFQGSFFTEWKSTGSLLWLHGKRMFP